MDKEKLINDLIDYLKLLIQREEEYKNIDNNNLRVISLYKKELNTLNLEIDFINNILINDMKLSLNEINLGIEYILQDKNIKNEVNDLLNDDFENIIEEYEKDMKNELKNELNNLLNDDFENIIEEYEKDKYYDIIETNKLFKDFNKNINSFNENETFTLLINNKNINDIENFKKDLYNIDNKLYMIYENYILNYFKINSSIRILSNQLIKEISKSNYYSKNFNDIIFYLKNHSYN